MLGRYSLLAAESLIGLVLAAVPVAAIAQSVSPAEARAIAKEAYIYGFPLVDSYRVQYSYFVERSSPEFKAPWNRLYNTARVYTPDDKAIQTPNSDTPYSFVGADLRAEPLVFTVPAVEKERYYSSSSSTCTPSISPMSAAARPVTTPGNSFSPARIGKVIRRRVSSR